MARVKGGPAKHKRHKKLLKQAKGYYGAKSKTYKAAHQTVMRAMAFAYIGRKQKKREYRKLWIARINAATRMHGMSYSKFIHGLKVNNIDVNRKMLSEMAIHDPQGFEELVNIAKEA